MIRKLALAVAFGMAVPAAAVACSSHEQQAKTDQANSQALLLAQADTQRSPTPGKKAPKKGKSKKHPKSDMPK